jgi:Tfp pilus assembly protein PilF
MNNMKTVACLLSGAVILLLVGCASIGPGRVTQDRFDDTPGLEPAAAQVRPPKPQPQEKHYRAARAALMGGNTDKANLEVKLALQDNPLDAASHFLLGCLLERKGEHDQAIVAFQRAVELDPTNPDALYNLGTMLLWRGEVVPASRLLENAVLIRPDHVPSRNNLAKAYFLAGLPELAVASYEEVLRRDSSNAIALNNLLLLAEAAGNHDTAATYRRRLEALGSGRAAKPTIDAGEPITLLPTWPLATAAVGSPSPTPLPVMPVPKPPAPPDREADALRELLRDLPHVTVERRAGRLTLSGYTSGPKERAMLDRILGKPSVVLDLTSDDSGDPQRMIEFDAVLFIMTGLDQQDVGFNFLRLIDVNFNYFASDNRRAGIGYQAPPAVTGFVTPPVAGPVTGDVTGLSQSGWIFSAAASYSVNIANAADERIAVLARPHLTALSGTSANFLAGGELVFRVSGNISGDIRPYPFGTSLKVTPTLLRTPAEDGTPRVHVKVEAGRVSVLSILNQDPDVPTSFSKVTVASEAVLSLGQTLILSGLSQRESRTGRSGVPYLRDMPILKYFFSTKTTVTADAAVIILLTPRDPAFSDERNRKARAEFVTMRRAYLKARQGTEEDMRRFRERYPDWQQVPPSRFASHLFMMETSALYRAASGEDLTSEELNLELLGPNTN